MNAWCILGIVLPVLFIALLGYSACILSSQISQQEEHRK